jgi:hypothetical protein
LDDTLKKVVILLEIHKEDMNLDQFALFTTYFNRISELILNWKRHQLRSVHQDHARQHALEQLDDSSVYIIMDWAMKWIEVKYREKQSDWFGKKGLPWHLMVVIRRQRARSDAPTTFSSNAYERRTFCHIFDQCKQDALSVVSIVQDVLKRLKMGDPKLRYVYLRSDNGACYHSAITTTAVRKIFETTGVLVRRIDFSEPQAGKDACDREAAVVKGEVRRHVNEKHDCTNCTEFVAAARSTRHLSIFASKLPAIDNSPSLTNSTSRSNKTSWPGISTIFNIQYQFALGNQVSRATNQIISQVCNSFRNISHSRLYD